MKSASSNHPLATAMANPPTAAGILLPALATLLLAACAQADTTLNTFDTGLGSWTTTQSTTAPGFDLGWSATGFAGGTAGEVGGLISRINSANGSLGTPRILDTIGFAGGNALTLDIPLSASGNVYLKDSSAAADLNFGYFSSTEPGRQRAALRIISPATAGSGLWRFRFGLGDSSGPRVNAPDVTWNAASLAFSFDWTPSGLHDGSGTLSGTVANGASVLTIPSVTLGANTTLLDSFGLWVDSAGSTDPTKVQYAYFDNVRYTVAPEPGPLALAAVGVATLMFAKRRSR